MKTIIKISISAIVQNKPSQNYGDVFVQYGSR